MERLQEILTRLNWNIDQLIDHLEKFLIQREKNRLRAAKRLATNKEAVYAKHREWRRNNPDYRRRKTELAKQRRNNAAGTSPTTF